MPHDPKVTKIVSELHKDTNAMQPSVHKRIMIAPGLRTAIIVLSLGVAIPLSAIGIGLGIRLATLQTVEGQILPNTEEAQGATSDDDLGGMQIRSEATSKLDQLPLPPGAVVQHFVIFSEEALEIDGKAFEVHVGHQYASSTQGTYDTAYCYARTDVDGIEAHLELSRKDDAFIAPRNINDPSAELIGLGNTELAELRRACRYLEVS